MGTSNPEYSFGFDPTGEHDFPCGRFYNLEGKIIDRPKELMIKSGQTSIAILETMNGSNNQKYYLEDTAINCDCGRALINGKCPPSCPQH